MPIPTHLKWRVFICLKCFQTAVECLPRRYSNFLFMCLKNKALPHSLSMIDASQMLPNRIDRHYHQVEQCRSCIQDHCEPTQARQHRRTASVALIFVQHDLFTIPGTSRDLAIKELGICCSRSTNSFRDSALRMISSQIFEFQNLQRSRDG